MIIVYQLLQVRKHKYVCVYTQRKRETEISYICSHDHERTPTQDAMGTSKGEYPLEVPGTDSQNLDGTAINVQIAN